jgi:hypothetical protein
MELSTWSCLSCGNSNSAKDTCCLHCQCPAQCTVDSLEYHRTGYLKSGRLLGPQAGLFREPSDSDGLELILGILATPFLLFWPFKSQKPKDKKTL